MNKKKMTVKLLISIMATLSLNVAISTGAEASVRRYVPYVSSPRTFCEDYAVKSINQGLAMEGLFEKTENEACASKGFHWKATYQRQKNWCQTHDDIERLWPVQNVLRERTIKLLGCLNALNSRTVVLNAEDLEKTNKELSRDRWNSINNVERSMQQIAAGAERFNSDYFWNSTGYMSAAIINYEFDTMDLMLKLGARVNSNGNGTTSDLAHVSNDTPSDNKYRVMQFILDNGGQVDSYGEDIVRQTPLMGAAKINDLAAVKILLSAGANPNRFDIDLGGNPLISAVENNNIEMVQVLLENQDQPANPNLALDGPACGQDGHYSWMTSLDRVNDDTNPGIKELLLEFGAKTALECSTTTN